LGGLQEAARLEALTSIEPAWSVVPGVVPPVEVSNAASAPPAVAAEMHGTSMGAAAAPLPPLRFFLTSSGDIRAAYTPPELQPGIHVIGGNARLNT
jgi:hypothetical protein